MSVEERIEKIRPYFGEMKIINGQDDVCFICISCRFPDKWKICPDATKEKYSTECTNEEGLSIFWCPITVGFDSIFDAIDYNINVNKLAQERIALFKNKMSELKDLFNNNDMTVETLRTLSFTWKGKGKGKKTSAPKESPETIDDIADNANLSEDTSGGTSEQPREDLPTEQK